VGDADLGVSRIVTAFAAGLHFVRQSLPASSFVAGGAYECISTIIATISN
jgi:hypothetical protein